MEAAPSSPLSEKRESRRIWTLLVDDSAEWLRAVRPFLESQKHVVVVGVAMDGRQALEQAEALEPDLVLLDVRLSGMSGLEIAANMRRKHPKIRIIMVTMHDKPYLRKAASAIGVDGFISKERVYQDLLGDIDRIFSEQPSPELAAVGT